MPEVHDIMLCNLFFFAGELYLRYILSMYKKVRTLRLVKWSSCKCGFDFFGLVAKKGKDNGIWVHQTNPPFVQEVRPYSPADDQCKKSRNEFTCRVPTLTLCFNFDAGMNNLLKN